MKMKKEMLKLRQGFTLIELMIVMAIIGVLAVALAPSLMGAQATARDTARTADMGKIKTAVQEFQSRYKQLPQVPMCFMEGTVVTNPATIPATPNVTGIVKTAGDVADASAFLVNQFEGGVAPTDPTGDIVVGGGTTAVSGITNCNGYLYIPMKKNARSRAATSYVIVASAESDKNVNVQCSNAALVANSDITLLSVGADAESLSAANNGADRCMYVVGG